MPTCPDKRAEEFHRYGNYINVISSHGGYDLMACPGTADWLCDLANAELFKTRRECPSWTG